MTVDRTKAPAPAALRPFHLSEVASTPLPNGLGLHLIPDPRVPLVSGVLVLPCGEAGVPETEAGWPGVAMEGLLGGVRAFQALPARDGAALAEALEQQGTAFRVSTGWDASQLSFTCMAERLSETLALLAQVVQAPDHPDSEVARIRQQRQAVLVQRGMDPSDLADDEADRVLYPEGHPWRRPALGTEASLAAVDRAGVQGWVARHLRPGGGGLVLAGDLDPDEALRATEEALGGWSGAPPLPPRLPQVTLGRTRPVVIRHRPGAVQTEIRVVHPGPPRSTDDYHALQVANAILGGAFTSRLNLNLRERHGFTYGVRSSWLLRRRGGEFVLSTAVGQEVTGAALEQIFHELALFLADGPTEEETARARDYLAGIFPLKMETAAQRAGRVAELISFQLPLDTHHHERDQIRAVTRDQAHAAVRTHLDGARAPLVLCADAEAVAAQVEALGLGVLEVRR
jgi:zinc protease